jgi:type II secretory pathway predicted ATPase ExeA
MPAETQTNNRPANPAHRTERPPTLEDHLRAWGLHHAPFAATASTSDKSAELYASAAHGEIRHLLDTTAALRGVMTLTGSPGTGKSTLIKSWIAGLEPKRFLPLLITQSSLSATGVLETLLSKLGEAPGFKRSANLLKLEKHLADLDPLTLVLVLDDAQNYPGAALEEIRLLLGLGGRARSAFALVLLGDEYLIGSLRLSVQRALFSRISASAATEPLPPKDIPAYLAWHISRAGLESDVFTAAAIDLLTEASEGNPRTLGLLAQAAWLAAARDNLFTIQPAHVHTALRQVPSAKARITQA